MKDKGLIAFKSLSEEEQKELMFYFGVYDIEDMSEDWKDILKHDKYETI